MGETAASQTAPEAGLSTPQEPLHDTAERPQVGRDVVPGKSGEPFRTVIQKIEVTNSPFLLPCSQNRGNGLDMNVIPAWKEGVTGKGVVVTILDDGLESDHPDLEHNYVSKMGYSCR